MIAEALKFLKENFQKREETLEVAGRRFIRGGEGEAWLEVRPEPDIDQLYRNEHGQALQFNTVSSMAAFILNQQCRRVHVLVGTRGVKAIFDLDTMYQAKEMAVLANACHLYYALPEEKGELTFLKFHDWLDQHGDTVKEIDELRAAMRRLTVVDHKELKLEQSGPIITANLTDRKGIEGSTVSIPKQITITLPTGTPEFLIEHIYLLRLTATNGLVFTLTHKQHDGSSEELVRQVVAKLSELLPGIPVYEGE
jgi:hypothetical protein